MFNGSRAGHVTDYIFKFNKRGIDHESDKKWREGEVLPVGVTGEALQTRQARRSGEEG